MKLAEEKLREIQDIIAKENKSTYDLLSGTGGISLFYYSLFTATSNKQYAQEAINYINKSIKLLQKSTTYPTYAAGIAGLGTYLAYLESIEFASNIINNEVDDYLFCQLEHYINNNYYDYLHGVIGIAIYFLYKYRVAKNDCTHAALNLTLRYLQSTKIIENDGYKWGVPSKKRSGIEFNISLSHGISAIIFFLTKLHHIGFETDVDITNIILRAIKYINYQQIPVKQYNSFYPYLAIESTPVITGSRLAWCYGDLGIALTQYNAGRELDNHQIIQNALEILKYAAIYRRNIIANGIVDAGICHGSAGVAHIFNLMYHNTKLELFKEAADYWIQETILQSAHSDGYAGYSVWCPGNTYHKSLGLLEGISGIALSFMSYLYPKTFNWDQFLLMSL